jgi:hypothetical protein
VTAVRHSPTASEASLASCTSCPFALAAGVTLMQGAIRAVPMTADEIFDRPAAASPWPSWQPLVALVSELLPTIEDLLILDLVECLGLALVERDEEVHAVRAVLSLALAESHIQYEEILRLRRRLADLLDARRRERTFE